jgi:Na+/glutamate symporter
METRIADKGIELLFLVSRHTMEREYYTPRHPRNFRIATVFTTVLYSTTLATKKKGGKPVQ